MTWASFYQLTDPEEDEVGVGSGRADGHIDNQRNNALLEENVATAATVLPTGGKAPDVHSQVSNRNYNNTMSSKDYHNINHKHTIVNN